MWKAPLGRKAKYLDSADRQAAYRQRQRELLDDALIALAQFKNPSPRYIGRCVRVALDKGVSDAVGGAHNVAGVTVDGVGRRAAAAAAAEILELVCSAIRDVAGADVLDAALDELSQRPPRHSKPNQRAA